MAKYLIQGSYRPEGMKGLQSEGGTGRREAVEKLAASLGGSIESMYYAFGEADVYVIMDAPDNVTAAAAAMAVTGSGAATARTTVLLTAEEVDAATQMMPGYRPPGG